jgi:2-polyprenyl-3-methyl-5-hydroxy-6-metoxy-1,4-benzoquinol methylase
MGDPRLCRRDRLDAAVRRYLEQDDNRGHYRRAEQTLLAVGAQYADELVALRREELQGWRETWWRRLRREPVRILDAGCGPGFVAAAMADQLPASRVVGVDIEPEAIAVAQLLAEQRPNLTVHQAALESLPADLDEFDLIFCRTTLEHVFDVRAALGGLLDALAPAGALFLETPNYLFPYEPHLRLWMLPKSPKWLLRAECKLLRRDAEFVEHLQFACDPRTLVRWARQHGDYEVADLMSDRLIGVLEGRQRSAVAWRQRAVSMVAGLTRRTPLLTRRLTQLPIWPSAQLLITRAD